MTTVQTMLPHALRRAAIALCLAAFAALSACAPKDTLSPPDVLVAPYHAVSGDVLWAVAPLVNESGVSFVDTGMIADQIIHSIDQVRGLACLPLNRTIAAMRARGMTSVASPQDARALATALGVDGLIVGVVAAYDPYDPPKLGLKLALFARNPGVESASLDPLRLQISYTEFDRKLATQYLTKPVATVSQHLDGSNHEVQMEVRRYATGRHEAETALGWKAIMASMDLYTQFSAFVAVSRLIDQERIRLAQPSQSSSASAETTKPEYTPFTR